MFYLVLTVLLTVLLSVVFRYFEKFGVDNFPAIVVNYFVSAGVGSWYAQKIPFVAFSTGETWLPYAMIISLLFIIAFYILARTIQYFGISYTALIQKTSLVFTVLFAVFFFGDKIGIQKISGVLAALAAIYLITKKGSDPSLQKKWTIGLLLLPIITFVFSGVIDVLFFFLERTARVIPGDAHFVSFLFCMAGCYGLLVVLGRGLFLKKWPGKKEIVGGILLGLPNFFSIHFYLLAMGEVGGALAVPMVAVATILMSALVGYFLFQETMSKANLAGIGLAILSIVLLSMTIG